MEPAAGKVKFLFVFISLVNYGLLLRPLSFRRPKQRVNSTLLVIVARSQTRRNQLRNMTIIGKQNRIYSLFLHFLFLVNRTFNNYQKLFWKLCKDIRFLLDFLC